MHHEPALLKSRAPGLLYERTRPKLVEPAPVKVPTYHAVSVLPVPIGNGRAASAARSVPVKTMAGYDVLNPVALYCGKLVLPALNIVLPPPLPSATLRIFVPLRVRLARLL